MKAGFHEILFSPKYLFSCAVINEKNYKYEGLVIKWHKRMSEKVSLVQIPLIERPLDILQRQNKKKEKNSVTWKII